MKWSIKIGKIAGIDLKIHLTFLILLLWVAVSGLTNGETSLETLVNFALVLGLFFFVILHEFGHALMARRFGIPTKDITLLPIGGLARVDHMPEEPFKEFLVAAAGPMVNVILAGLIAGGLALSGFFTQPLTLDLIAGNFWMQLLLANVTLVVFNVIPAFPMDGGRMLRALLALVMDRVKATKVAAGVGRGFAVLMGVLGMFFNTWLILTSIFVWWSAGAEAQAETIKAGLDGLSVRDVLVNLFYQVEANQPLTTVYQLTASTGQRDMPVTSNGHFLGMIRHEDLKAAIERLGTRAPAYAAIGVEPVGLDPQMPVNDMLPRFAECSTQPVIENGQLIGLVTPQSVQQMIWLRDHNWPVDPRSPEEEVTPQA
ncbi:MAG: site-2 protease family protein [Anaerolineaceae bacterium]|nr:site-2 protease family protein [Anaerolineaceae bacterium]